MQRARSGPVSATMDEVLGDVSYSAAEVDRVYRIWVRDGRLLGLPAKRSRRLPLLDLVAQDFEPGRSYTGHQVRSRLSRWYSDTATLGRYLVDEGFLDRLPDGSRWWRCGGTVGLDVSALAERVQVRTSAPGGPARSARRP